MSRTTITKPLVWKKFSFLKNHARMLKNASNSFYNPSSPSIPLPNSMSAEEMVKANEVLISFMNDDVFQTLDNEDEDVERDKVIQKLDNMVRAWAREIGVSKGISEELLENGGGIQHFLFGSTMLKVHNIDSDIDILCVAPSFISREDFFTSFCERLAESSGVEYLQSIPEAYTPVIKFVMDGLSVDIVFASFQFSTLPVPIDVYDLKYLKGMDEQSIRSLNGVRVAHWITRLIPDIENYRIALRLVKYWAKERGIYSNILGFLGGVNYAILVAFICKLYPHANPYVLVERFFAVYTMWQWPTPIMLREYEDLEFQDSDGRYLAVWNPLVNYKDALHMMPIITPSYPSMNSAYNIAQPQFRCIQEEIYRGQALFQEHPRGVDFPWKVLLEPSTKEFFTRYPRYIQIDITATSPGDHRSWFGWVESRLRSLIVALEQPPSIFCHPTANCFHRQPNSSLKSPSKAKQYFSAISTSISAGEEQPSSAITTPPYSITSSPTNVEADPAPIQSENAVKKDEMGDDSDKMPTDPVSECGNNTTVGDPPVQPIENKAGFETPQRKRGNQEMLNGDGQENLHVTSFFIGLSFRKGLARADVTHTVEEFSEKVNCWKSKTSGMTLNITSCDSKSIPPFVLVTKAKPSNIESCTPKLPRHKQVGSAACGVPNLQAVQSPSSALHHLDYSQYGSHSNPPCSSTAASSPGPVSVQKDSSVFDVTESTYASVLANGTSSKTLRTPLSSPNRLSQSQKRTTNAPNNPIMNNQTAPNPSTSANANANRTANLNSNVRRSEPSQNPAHVSVVPPPPQPIQQIPQMQQMQQIQQIQRLYPQQQSYAPPPHEYLMTNNGSSEFMMALRSDHPSMYARSHADRAYSDDLLIRGSTFPSENQIHLMSRRAYNYSPEQFANNPQSMGGNGNGVMNNNHNNSGGNIFPSYQSYDNYLSSLSHRNSSGNSKSFSRRPVPQHHLHHQMQQTSPNRPHSTNYRSYSLGNIGHMYYTNNNGMDGVDAVNGAGGLMQHNLPAPPPYLSPMPHPSLASSAGPKPVHSPITMRHAPGSVHQNGIQSTNTSMFAPSSNSPDREDHDCRSDVSGHQSQNMRNPSSQMFVDIPPHVPSHAFPPLTFGAIRPSPIPGNGNTSTTSTVTTVSNEMMEVDAMSVESNELAVYGDDETSPPIYYTPHSSHPQQIPMINTSMTPNSGRLFRKELPTGKEYGHKKQ